MPAGSDFAADKARSLTHAGLADIPGGYRAWNKGIYKRRYESGEDEDPSPSMLHKLYARGIFTGINRELPYTGLTIVDAETTTDDVNIVIIHYYEHVTSSSGGLGEVSGVCNADLTY